MKSDLLLESTDLLLLITESSKGLLDFELDEDLLLRGSAVRTPSF